MSMKDVFYSLGKANALALRASAATMTGTEIIDREHDAPLFDPAKDYSGFPAGSPVRDGDQVWLLIQPHNAAHYSGRPENLRALWGLAHTKDPKKAKPWVDAYGTSGMYMLDECYKAEDGTVWCALQDNLVYTADALPSAWKKVE